MVDIGDNNIDTQLPPEFMEIYETIVHKLN